MAPPPPSPTMPIIVLLMLVTMLTISSMMTYDPEYWISTMKQVQTHFVLGAFLIPICLLLAVQVFGIPQVNPVEQRTASAPTFITQTTSILLAMIIFVLLMLIPLGGALVGP
jgi:cytochrome b561